MDHRDRLMGPTEVAALFQVAPRTISRWGDSGRLTAIVTPTGHRKFRESEIMLLLQTYLPGDE